MQIDTSFIICIAILKTMKKLLKALQGFAGNIREAFTALQKAISEIGKYNYKIKDIVCLFVCLFVLMVSNATLNNIWLSVISWRWVLLVEGPGENHRHVTNHWQTLLHNVVHLAMIEIRTHNKHLAVK